MPHIISVVCYGIWKRINMDAVSIMATTMVGVPLLRHSRCVVVAVLSLSIAHLYSQIQHLFIHSW